MNKITSKENQKIKELIKLYDNKYRKEKSLFIVEGYHLLEMALSNNLVKEIYTLKEIEGIDSSIPQYQINEDILKKISKTKSPQGVVAICHFKKEKPIGNRLIYLDNIQDPGNLGTILRSALAFSYFDVVISSDSVSLYNEKVISASQGAIFKLNILLDKDASYLNRLKEDGYQLISTALKDSKNINEIKLKDKYVLIFGNEGQGIRKEILDISDDKLKIDMDNIDSLNVGVAASILMYLFK